MNITAENYFSKELELRYCSSSQYRNFSGTKGYPGCEAATMAKIKGLWEEETSQAFLIGGFIDAHFTGTLDVFKAQHPQIFTKKGTLTAEFEHAETMIRRIERDNLFMKTLSGRMQKIETATFFGLDWKCKLDSYHDGKAIVDLKTTKSIRKKHSTKDYGKISFVEYWGYEIQLALYQKIVEVNTGEKLPVFIAAVSKEPEPDIEIIAIDDTTIASVLADVEKNALRIKQLKSGEVLPLRCGICAYCKNTKILTNPIHFLDL